MKQAKKYTIENPLYEHPADNPYYLFFKKENFFLPFAVFFSLPVIITSYLFFTNEDKSILIIIFLILFALVDIILWGIVTKVMLANLKNRLVRSKGIEHKATITKNF